MKQTSTTPFAYTIGKFGVQAPTAATVSGPLSEILCRQTLHPCSDH